MSKVRTGITEAMLRAERFARTRAWHQWAALGVIAVMLAFATYMALRR